MLNLRQGIWELFPTKGVLEVTRRRKDFHVRRLLKCSGTALD